MAKKIIKTSKTLNERVDSLVNLIENHNYNDASFELPFIIINNVKYDVYVELKESKS